MSRKSLPTQVISDNASTYLAAVEEIKELFESSDLREALGTSMLLEVSYQSVPHGMEDFGRGLWDLLSRL